MTNTRSGMTPEVIEELVNRCVEEALAAHEATRAANALETENQSQNSSDGDNGNGGNGNGGNKNPDDNVRGDRPVARECTYQDFMKCQPLNFKGMEGVVGLIRWFEKMEIQCSISATSLKMSQLRITSLSGNKGNATHEGQCTALSVVTLRDWTSSQGIAKIVVIVPYSRNSRVPNQKPWGTKRESYDARGKADVMEDGGAEPEVSQSLHGALLDITPSALDVSYAVELADERTSETNTVLRGCTLGLLGYPFNTDMMPIELGSFDVIIGMDWLAKNHAVIVCDEKIVRIPYGNESLIVQGDKSDKEKKSTLSIISCVKA
ncbi:reverse transcriptase domain-containing protein [Tanacetum coccineum]